ncbi:MAG: ribulose-phosphate 3-epimerase [Firmicutes bacterium]|nr:ribulose-phosphate 3-epimerase [Bacillota bacterium]
MLEIVPSLASANQSCLKDEIEKLGKDTVKEIHLDIEDGNFIPNITFGFKTVKDLRAVTELPFSIHLMVNAPEKYLPKIRSFDVASVAVHLEACKYPKEIINLVKDLNMEIGMALNPKTPLDELEYILDDLDFILIMTAEPDCRGQEFILHTLKKVSELSLLKKGHQKIWVDGGINETHLYDIWKSGADKVVMGRAIFNAENPKLKLEKLRDMIKNFK